LEIVNDPRREFAMEKMEDILYSLIPLVIIVLISWLFSFLASKKRKQEDGVEDGPQTSPKNQFLEFLSDEEDDDEDLILEKDLNSDKGDQQRFDLDTWAPDVPTGGPEVTPKPIKPKWWGA
jgi:hypothetical protein